MIIVVLFFMHNTMIKKFRLFPLKWLNSLLRYAIILFCFCIPVQRIEAAVYTNADTTPLSTRKMAIDYMNNIGTVPQSTWWPAVQPALFIQNIKNNILHPLRIYAGAGTDFCSYSAFSYLILKDNPLGYARFMMAIYVDGNAVMGKVEFNPSKGVRKAAGMLRFKGRLDISPADQLWFLVLADEFKGYLNMFDRNYHAGGESNLWASTNYAKFNRMVGRLLNYRIESKGSDLVRPIIPDLYGYLAERLKTGIVVLFVNNSFLYKKNHTLLKLGLPTHFIILQDLSIADNIITITYWDYGCKTRRQMTPRFLSKILFGVSHCTIKTNHEN